MTLEEYSESAHEIQRIYYANERYFDNYPFAEHLGLDNVVISADDKYWYDKGQITKEQYIESLKEDFVFFAALNWICDCAGYGMGAASRGFNVTRPLGRIWTITQGLLSYLRTEVRAQGADSKDWYQEGQELARKANVK